MEVRRPRQHADAEMTSTEVPGFDAAERAERVKTSTAIREQIAADRARLMAWAKRENWGYCLGAPPLAGTTLGYAFAMGRRRGPRPPHKPTAPIP